MTVEINFIQVDVMAKNNLRQNLTVLTYLVLQISKGCTGLCLNNKKMCPKNFEFPFYLVSEISLDFEAI